MSGRDTRTQDSIAAWAAAARRGDEARRAAGHIGGPRAPHRYDRILDDLCEPADRPGLTTQQHQLRTAPDPDHLAGSREWQDRVDNRAHLAWAAMRVWVARASRSNTVLAACLLLALVSVLNSIVRHGNEHPAKFTHLLLKGLP